MVEIDLYYSVGISILEHLVHDLMFRSYIHMIGNGQANGSCIKIVSVQKEGQTKFKLELQVNSNTDGKFLLVKTPPFWKKLNCPGYLTYSTSDLILALVMKI